EILQWRFDKIFFTGSTRVGKIVYEAAAKNLIPVTLELGGKSPAIVTKNADLQVAAKRIVWGKFLNAGQTCVAPDYLLVEEDIKDRFITLLKQRIEETGYEDGAQHYVKIINDRNFNRLLRLIDSSKVVYGGNFDESTLYIGPTVMDHVIWEDAVMQEEIFGPILPVITFKKLDHALEEIQARERPLSAYLFSDNKKEKDIFIRHIPFGGGCINDTIMHLVNGNIPFGGVGNSGIGNYHGKFGFDTFSHKKAILKKAKLGAENIKLPPYSESKFKWIKKLI
ncbi:MAG: aldehyde dehydrogenase family protein, partial [Bacteroidales bacterium]|nr:aldehyde dehydrogenase family protein [Bacteroidales bacterium]